MYLQFIGLILVKASLALPKRGDTTMAAAFASTQPISSLDYLAYEQCEHEIPKTSEQVANHVKNCPWCTTYKRQLEVILDKSVSEEAWWNGHPDTEVG
jgi:hypothetical protein